MRVLLCTYSRARIKLRTPLIEAAHASCFVLYTRTGFGGKREFLSGLDHTFSGSGFGGPITPKKSEDLTMTVVLVKLVGAYGKAGGYLGNHK